MSTRILYRRLALERCRQNLAQLCAVVHLAEGTDYSETVLSLVEGLNRDLGLIEGSFSAFPAGAMNADETEVGAKIINFVHEMQDQ